LGCAGRPRRQHHQHVGGRHGLWWHGLLHLQHLVPCWPRQEDRGVLPPPPTLGTWTASTSTRRGVSLLVRGSEMGACLEGHRGRWSGRRNCWGTNALHPQARLSCTPEGEYVVCGAVAAGGVCKGGAVGLGDGKRCGCVLFLEESPQSNQLSIAAWCHNLEFDFSQPRPSCLPARDRRCTGIPRS
jgi:hypothetical protein